MPLAQLPAPFNHLDWREGVLPGRERRERMKKQRKPCTPAEKAAILRRHLVEKEPISKLCDELGLQPRVFYRWQKEFFENGAVAFEQKARPNHSAGRFRSSNGRPRWSWPFQPQQIKRVEMLWASAAHEIG